MPEPKKRNCRCLACRCCKRHHERTENGYGRCLKCNNCVGFV